MNTQSFERQLQQIDPPAPDPEARLRARHAAVEEFERLHQQTERKPHATRMADAEAVARRLCHGVPGHRRRIASYG